MLRWILILVVLGLVSVVAGYFAQHPGSVTLEWQDYRIETSFALLVVALAIAVVVVALLYRLWWSLRRAPNRISRARREQRSRRGYEALTRGLVAAAAGDADTARRQARRATALLDDRPLTMLLSAQAAQLDGDEQAAAKFFAAMQRRPETEFLGVRGLLTQAMKRQDWPAALKLAERAYRLNPKSEWVVATLYDLQKRTGRWEDAETTLSRSMKMKLIPASDLPRQRAELLHNKSLETSGAEAIKWARKAFRSDPGYVPAATRLAKLWLADGKRRRRAAAVIERAWQHTPDPELADVYWEARQCDDALKKVQAAQRLAAHNPDHIESRITVAVAALEARLWGEARSNLESIAGDEAPPRVCRLMAELEEAEHGDLARARMWLMRATRDEHGPEMSSPVPQMMPRVAD